MRFYICMKDRKGFIVSSFFGSIFSRLSVSLECVPVSLQKIEYSGAGCSFSTFLDLFFHNALQRTAARRNTHNTMRHNAPHCRTQNILPVSWEKIEYSGAGCSFSSQHLLTQFHQRTATQRRALQHAQLTAPQCTKL